MNNKDLSDEKWFLLHMIPKEDILDFILKNDLAHYFKNAIDKHLFKDVKIIDYLSLIGPKYDSKQLMKIIEFNLEYKYPIPFTP